MALLAARATVRVSVLRALELLDRPALQVLELLAILDGRATVTELAKRLPGSNDTSLHWAADRLLELAVCYSDADGALIAPRAVLDVVDDRPAGLGRPARRLLDLQTSDRMSALAAHFGIQLPASREARLDALAAAYRPAALEGELDTIDPAASDVLSRLDAGGAIGSLPRATSITDDGSPVRQLLAHGLLLAVDPDTVELPREVGVALRGDSPVGPAEVEPPALTGRPVSQASADSTGAGQAAETVRLLESLLEAIAANPPSSLRAGGLSVRDLRRLARGADTDEPTTALLLETAYAAGLLDRSSDLAPVWLPTPAYDGWLGRDVSAQWAPLVSAWLVSPRAPGVVGERDASTNKVVAALGPDASRPVAAVFRLEALRLLQELPAGTTMSLAEALALLEWRAPRRNARMRAPAVEWAVAEAATLGVTGRGALTRAGRRLLEGDVESAIEALHRELPEPVHTVLLQADLTAVAAGRLAPDTARSLALVADLESAGAASVYRFSAASIRRALDTGMSGDAVSAFLEQVAATPVPQTLSYLVEDVARRHGVLRAGAAASYLRCDDTALLAEVVSAKATQALGLRWLAPTVAVAEVGPQLLLDGLRAAGFAPAAEGSGGITTLGRQDRRRTPYRARVSRVEGPQLSAQQVERAITVLRGGDAAARAGRRATGPMDRALDGGSAAPRPDRSLQSTLALLEAALRDKTRLRITYVDPTGRLTERTIDPRAVESGYLSAYDERAQVTRTFAIRNISDVERLAS